MTSQPSLSAARTTPRSTALSPGQSPPLVRIPMRVFMTKTNSKHFLRISKPAAVRPLVVQIPTLGDKLSAFTKSICAAEQHDNDSARINSIAALRLRDHLRFAGRRKNQTLSGARSLAGFHAIDSIGAE